MTRKKGNVKDVKKIGLIVFVSILSYLLPLPIQNEAKIVLTILVLASLLWVTETIPLFLTSLIATILLVIFNIFSLKEASVAFADPVILLLLGGFLIAQAMQSNKIDVWIAKHVTCRVKHNRTMLLTLMIVTAFLSMWISNTASTIIMIPIALGIVAKFRKKLANFTKATVLGVAYSANIGGIGTILGSPPNAITVAKLLEISHVTVTFLDWMKAALPLVILLVPIAWFVLIRMFPFPDMTLTTLSRPRGLKEKQKYFFVIFVATIILWLTTSVHGMSSALIAIMSAAVLFLVGLLKPSDVNEINYRILILFGGGLVLGSAIFSSGLSDFFAQSIALALDGAHTQIILFSVILSSLALTAFAANTATAAIVIPITLSLAGLLHLPEKSLSMVSGIAVSLAFLLPVSTPPNAIAYATGKISIADMLKAGTVLTVASIIILVFAAMILW